MANNNEMYSTGHVLDIIRAALPYVNSRTKNSMELAIKTGELAESISLIQNPEELSACDLNEQPLDIEGLLNSVQGVCFTPEREIINTLLNFYKTRNLYHSYQEFKKTNTNSAQEPQGFQKEPELEAASMNNRSNQQNSFFDSAPLIQFLMSQLTPEQKAAFEGMSMLINNNTNAQGNRNTSNFNSRNPFNFGNNSK